MPDRKTLRPSDRLAELERQLKNAREGVAKGIEDARRLLLDIQRERESTTKRHGERRKGRR